MLRGKRNTDHADKTSETKSRPRRKNAKATEEAPPPDQKLEAAEAELVRKYPDRRFKPGSLLPAGAVPDFGHKRTIILLCADCDVERRVATSDIFHVSRCAGCSKQARKKKPKKGESNS